MNNIYARFLFIIVGFLLIVYSIANWINGNGELFAPKLSFEAPGIIPTLLIGILLFVGGILFNDSESKSSDLLAKETKYKNLSQLKSQKKQRKKKQLARKKR